MIGLKALSGGHSGENLGWYVVGLFDRVGIMDKKRSKVCLFVFTLTTFWNSHVIYQLYTATLDNTGNNNTTCKTIEDIHVQWGLPKWDHRKKQLPYFYSLFQVIYFSEELLVVALGMSWTLGMLMLWITSQRSQLLKTWPQSGNISAKCHVSWKTLENSLILKDGF